MKQELKAAYSEVAELRQASVMKDRKISTLQSKNSALAMDPSGSSLSNNQNSMREPKRRNLAEILSSQHSASAAGLPELNGVISQ